MRQLKRTVKIGNITIGGTNPIAVQTMLNVPVKDIAGNVEQAKRVAKAGCQIVRVTVPTPADAAVVSAIKEAVDIPVVADIHFDYRAALAAIDAGADKIRINPGNIGDDDRVKAVADACNAKNIPIRIGDITMAIFDVGNHIVTSAAGVITGSTTLDVTSTLQSMFNSQLSTMGIGELIGLGIETMIVSLCMKIISLLITVMLYGRMIEIYLYVSVAPVPFATLSNREWGGIGSNYIKGLCALAFQGFFIMVCVAIYAVLVSSVAVAGNLHTALWSVAAYTVILCFSLFKTGSLSKSIFNAH